MKTLLDIWDRRAKHPEKAPEKPRPDWIGEVPPDPIRNKSQISAVPKNLETAKQLFGQRLQAVETWANEAVAPGMIALTKKQEELEKKMATTNAELQPLIQNALQVVQDLSAKQTEVIGKLDEATKALEAQTLKYKTACDERDAALHREQVALQDGDKAKAQLQELLQAVAGLHAQATGAVNKSA
jgi:chromosome segregation ATPase